MPKGRGNSNIYKILCLYLFLKEIFSTTQEYKVNFLYFVKWELIIQFNKNTTLDIVCFQYENLKQYVFKYYFLFQITIFLNIFLKMIFYHFKFHSTDVSTHPLHDFSAMH